MASNQQYRPHDSGGRIYQIGCIKRIFRYVHGCDSTGCNIGCSGTLLPQTESVFTEENTCRTKTDMVVMAKSNYRLPLH